MRTSHPGAGTRGAWFYTSAPLTPVLVDILCSVHCYHCYSYCCCLLCCCCSVVLNLSLSQFRGFVFHSLCGGGAAAAWSQTPAGAKPLHSRFLERYTTKKLSLLSFKREREPGLTRIDRCPGSTRIGLSFPSSGGGSSSWVIQIPCGRHILAPKRDSRSETVG